MMEDKAEDQNNKVKRALDQPTSESRRRMSFLQSSPPKKTEHDLGIVTGTGDPLYAKFNDVLKYFPGSVKMFFAGWSRDPASLWKPIIFITDSKIQI